MGLEIETSVADHVALADVVGPQLADSMSLDQEPADLGARDDEWAAMLARLESRSAVLSRKRLDRRALIDLTEERERMLRKGVEEERELDEFERRIEQLEDTEQCERLMLELSELKQERADFNALLRRLPIRPRLPVASLDRAQPLPPRARPRARHRPGRRRASRTGPDPPDDEPPGGRLLCDLEHPPTGVGGVGKRSS
jgi:exoribonuclease R